MRLPRWRRGSSPIILFRKLEDARWNRSKPSGEQSIALAMRTAESRRRVATVATGLWPVTSTLLFTLGIRPTGPWLQHLLNRSRLIVRDCAVSSGLVRGHWERLELY